MPKMGTFPEGSRGARSDATGSTMVTSGRHAAVPDEILGYLDADVWSNEIVSGCARRRSEDLWTVVFYDFPVRAHGATLHDALDAAGSDLVLYIAEAGQRLRGRESGRFVSIEELKSPIELRRRAKWEFGLFVSRALRHVAEDWFDVRPINVPLAHATCAEEIRLVTFPMIDGEFVDEDDEAALMAEGYRELSDDLLALAEESAHAAAEALPPAR